MKNEQFEGELVQARKQQQQNVIKAPVSGTIYSVKATEVRCRLVKSCYQFFQKAKLLCLKSKSSTEILDLFGGMKAR